MASFSSEKMRQKSFVVRYYTALFLLATKLHESLVVQKKFIDITGVSGLDDNGFTEAIFVPLARIVHRPDTVYELRDQKTLLINRGAVNQHKDVDIEATIKEAFKTGDFAETYFKAFCKYFYQHLVINGVTSGNTTNYDSIDYESKDSANFVPLFEISLIDTKTLTEISTLLDQDGTEESSVNAAISKLRVFPELVECKEFFDAIEEFLADTNV